MTTPEVIRAELCAAISEFLERVRACVPQREELHGHIHTTTPAISDYQWQELWDLDAKIGLLSAQIGLVLPSLTPQHMYIGDQLLPYTRLHICHGELPDGSAPAADDINPEEAWWSAMSALRNAVCGLPTDPDERQSPLAGSTGSSYSSGQSVFSPWSYSDGKFRVNEDTFEIADIPRKVFENLATSPECKMTADQLKSAIDEWDLHTTNQAVSQTVTRLNKVLAKAFGSSRIDPRS